MKKLLFCVIALVAVVSASAQIFKVDVAAHGITSGGNPVAAGYEWGKISDVLTISNAFATNHKTVVCTTNNYKKVIIDGNEIDASDGIQGNDNPKDEDGGNPALTLKPAVSGAVIKIEAKKNGWVYIVAKLSTNKQYMVFEDGAPMGYKIAMENNDARVKDGVLNLEIKGDGKYDYISDGRQIQWVIREYLNDVEAATAGYGLGVFYFPVIEGCSYLAHSTGSKIPWSGIYFSETEVKSVSVEGDGISKILVDNPNPSPSPTNKFDVWSIAGDSELFDSDWDITDKRNKMSTTDGVNFNCKKTGVILEKGTYEYRVGKDYAWDVAYPADKAKLLINETGTYTITFIFNAETHELSASAERTVLTFSYNPNEKVAEVIQKPSGKYTGNIIIPATVMHEGEEYIVTKISDSAFSGCTGLTSITIPNSVTSIGNSAFSGCTGLTSITIPNSVTSIGISAFSGCIGLTSITIPNSVTSIGISAFSECIGLTSITIPNSVTSIGSSAFYGCTSLASIVVDSGNENYDSRENCNAIIKKTSNTLIIGCKNSIVPNSVTAIGNSAFFGCTFLTSITIPNSVTSIGSSAFSYCRGLTSITIPNSVTTIGNNAFQGCSGLTSIVVENGNQYYDSRDNCNAIIEKASNTLISGCKNTIVPNSVTAIGNYAFSDRTSLTSIAIPNSVTSIGSYAFYGCIYLSSLTIGNGVTSIGQYAFNSCNSLNNIVSRITNPFTIGDNVFSNYAKVTLAVPIGTKTAYQTTTGWNNFTNIIEVANARTIHVETAGTLPNLISKDEKYQIDELTLSGELNGTDIHLIRDMAGINMDKMEDCEFNPTYDAKTKGRLRVLDLSDAYIVEGGRDYYRMLTSSVRHSFDYHKYTKANEISDCMFNLCWKLEELILPRSVTTISGLFANYAGRNDQINIKVLKVADGNQYYDSRGDCNAIIEKKTNTLLYGSPSTVIPNDVTSIGNGAFSYCIGPAS